MANEELKKTLNAAAESLSVLSYGRTFQIVSELVVLFDALKEEKNQTVDLLNALAERYTPLKFRKDLEQAVLTCLAGKCHLESGPENDDTAFYFAHARRLFSALDTLIPAYIDELEPQKDEKTEGQLPRIVPSARRLTTHGSAFLRIADGALALEARRTRDRLAPFGEGRVYRHTEQGEFLPVKLQHVQSIHEFFGYTEARKILLEHFRNFAEGKSNLPLLICSLPGLGKTQMTVSHSLHFPEITLILPCLRDLAEGLEDLLRSLAAFHDRKFVLFFDDIDAAGTNWFYFREQVGGLFSPPDNISIVIASNLRFPANVSSRGRGFEFPMFDEIRCQEMVGDYLIAKGMHEPSPALISVIASDYVEEFSQKMFEELSPRTLVRYLKEYDANPEKRRKMLDFSKQELITKPDSQVFYAENVKLMRMIYGNDILEEFRQKEYGNV